jgi:uncharacterized membrane protein YedE/YeeE
LRKRRAVRDRRVALTRGTRPADAREVARALLGGIGIGLAAGLVLLLLGRIAGVTGIVAGVHRRSGWRLAFVAGLLAAGAVGTIAVPDAIVATSAPPAVAIAGGLLVGFGARYGGGCTSGHGVCGVGRLSRRSIVGCATFMAVAMAVVYVLRHGIAR